jgi:hypothetical protein
VALLSKSETETIGEVELEREVSRYIGVMSFVWISVDDAPGEESLRGYIERNAIALLSNYNKPPIDPPSANWLGHHCNRKKVRQSGGIVTGTSFYLLLLAWKWESKRVIPIS